MRASGHPFPEYIRFDLKEADSNAPSYDPEELRVDSRANVWLSAVKLACLPLRPLERSLVERKITDAAIRYGIPDDVNHAVSTVKELNAKVAGIETTTDYVKARDWFFANAPALDDELREKLADYLGERAEKVGHLPSLVERYRLDELSGRDPLTETVRQFAERNLHKLATGAVYRTDQFAVLPVDRVEECLPDLLRTASLGMNVIAPERIGKVASHLAEPEALVLESLLASYGQEPVHHDRNNPVEINDEILAAL